MERPVILAQRSHCQKRKEVRANGGSNHDLVSGQTKNTLRMLRVQPNARWLLFAQIHLVKARYLPSFAVFSVSQKRLSDQKWGDFRR